MGRVSSLMKMLASWTVMEIGNYLRILVYTFFLSNIYDKINLDSHQTTN